MAEHEGYSSGHPWYYKLGGRTLNPEEITAADFSEHKDWYIPKKKDEIPKKIEEYQQALAQDIKRYQDLVAKGNEAMSSYDLMFGGDMALFTALSLKHNHICYHKGVLALLEQENSNHPKQMSLF